MAEQFQDLARTIRVTRGGQAVEIDLPEAENKIWLAGSGKGELPVTMEHTGKNGCELKSTKAGALKHRLAQHNRTGESLAAEFIRELRELGNRKDTCSCGVSLKIV